MKNNLNDKFKYILLPAIIFAGCKVYAAPHFEPVKPLISKYLLVLLVLAVFFVIIYIGLSVYNKFFVSEALKNSQMDNISMRSPVDRDDAIYKFILRNRLK